ncbi:ABC transporter permease, partial [uncultured Muribaculum sp.]
MSYELLIARRLRFKDDGSSGVSPSIVIAIAGIALSLVIMMTAMCVVLGFKNEIRSKVMGFDAHVMILPGLADEYESQSGLLSFTPELREVIDDTKAFASAALVLEQPGILKTDTDYQGVVVKGMQPGAAWDFVKSNLVEGCVPDYSDDSDKNRVVISRSMADALNLGVDDRINAYFFTGNAVRARRLDIAGIYDTHFSDYDKLYVFGSLPLTQGLNSADVSAGS